MQRVIGLTRVLKDALEANIKQAKEPNTPLITFMVNHAATVINKFCGNEKERDRCERFRWQ